MDRTTQTTPAIPRASTVVDELQSGLYTTSALLEDLMRTLGVVVVEESSPQGLVPVPVPETRLHELNRMLFNQNQTLRRIVERLQA